MAVRWALLKRKAKELLLSAQVKSAPVPLEKIAAKIGATIRYQPLESEVSGMVHRRDDGSSIIGINSLHHDNRKRFSIAHELGHLVLHSDEGLHIDEFQPSVVGFRNELSSLGVDEKEIEANQFAAEILMPEDILFEDIKSLDSLGDPEHLVEELADSYKVSVQSMTIRLSKLGILR